MAKHSDHTEANDPFIKMLYVGTSGTGKTSSLISLMEAGYNLRILDMDNGLDNLIALAKDKCPERLDQLDYIKLRDKVTSDLTGPRVAHPKAYIAATKYLNKWDDGSVPAEWGSNTILVIDSLTNLGWSAYQWAKGMNPSTKDPRQWYGAAQESILTIVKLIRGEDFHANAIIITHINYKEVKGAETKGYPTSIGTALGPQLAGDFNIMISAETEGTGNNLQRIIRVVPSGGVDLKIPAPFRFKPKLRQETGLATIFKTLKESI